MTDLTQPHEAAPDEDPEVHIGQEVPDPWEVAGWGNPNSDPLGDVRGQLDWPLWFGGSQSSEDPRDSWPGY